MSDTSTTHRMRWYGVIPGAARDGAVPAYDETDTHVHGSDFRVKRNSHMNGRDWGWDVVCSCGWDSRTGGGTEAAVKRAIEDHRWDVRTNEEDAR